jgi:hypothetical protein
MKSLSKFICPLFLLSLQIPTAYAADIIVEDAYQAKVVLYSKDGDKQGTVDKSDILKKKILEVNEDEGLGKIDYKSAGNDENWIRISSVKLSQPVQGACPEQNVSAASDHTKLASSGWGCMK